MKWHRPVAAPPDKTLLIFDGECDFCRRGVRRCQETTGERVQYVPFQDASVTERFPELQRETLATAVHLIEPDGKVYFGAEAVFRALAKNPRKGGLLRWYERSSGFARLAERVYRFVVKHRSIFSCYLR